MPHGIEPSATPSEGRGLPLLCFSPTPWAEAAPRLREVMARFALSRAVHVIEPPRANPRAILRRAPSGRGPRLVTPLLPDFMDRRSVGALLHDWLEEIGPASAWFAGGEARGFAERPWRTVVLDLRGVPSEHGLPHGLMRRADLVLTDEAMPFLAPRASLHRVPEGVDIAHFGAARRLLAEPPEQLRLPRPLLGCFAGAAETIDADLLRALAAARPGWHIALLAEAPEGEWPANIHWLGPQPQAVLPNHVAHWDAVLLPYLPGEAADRAAPAEAMAALAAGRRVIGTQVVEVRRRFFGLGPVVLTGGMEAMADSVAAALKECDVSDFVAADDLLEEYSWDRVQQGIMTLLARCEEASLAAGTLPFPVPSAAVRQLEAAK